MDVVSEYVRRLTDDGRVSYFSKLMQLGFPHLEDDPFLVDSGETKEHLEKWSHSIETWPEVEFGNIYMFLIDCPGYTHKALKTYKSLPAYNLYANGCLHRLYIRHSPTGHSVIMGRVNRSQDPCEESHRAWVGFNHEDGSIICGHCTCMAGDSPSSVCSHAVAILFQVEAAPRGGYQPRDCSCCFHTVSKEPEEQLPENVPPTTINVTLDNGHITFSGDGEEENSKYFVTVLVDGQLGEVTDQAACEEINLKALEDVSMRPVEIKLEEGTTVPASSQNLETEDIADEDPTPDEILPSPRPPESPIKTEGHGKDLNQIESRTESSNCTVLENHQDTNSVVERESLNGADDDGNSTVFWTHGLNPPPSVFLGNHTGHCPPIVHIEDHTYAKLQNEAGRPIQTHLQSQEYSCSLCNRTFKSMRYFSLHMKKHPEQNLLKGQMKIYTAGRPFQCHECGRCFRRKSHLQRHMRCHSDEKPFICGHCGKGFKTSYGARLHSANHASGKLFKCPGCEEMFKRKVDLKQHLKSHAAKPSFKCSECGQLFKFNRSLLTHMKLHTGTLPYKCDVCERTFIKRCHFSAHKKIHSGEKAYKCNECGNTFRTKNGHREHMITHTGRPFQCKQCNKTFGRESTLYVHMRVHAAERPFMCDECGKSFTTAGYLRKHMWTHAKEKPFSCKECGKGFSSDSNLRRHVRIHTGELPFLCGICGLGFRQSTNFKVHLSMHTGEKPYKCTECDKRFNQKYQLRVHMTRHQEGEEAKLRAFKSKLKFRCGECGKVCPRNRVTNWHTVTPTGEKVFPCTVCDETFSNFRALLEHLNLHGEIVQLPDCSHHSPDQTYQCHLCEKSFYSYQYRRIHVRMVHTGETTFKCFTCGRGFTSNMSLKIHMRSHTGEKPFVCSTCGRAFSLPANLSRHIMTHTGERPYKCSQCDKAFGQFQSLCAHMRTHTGEKPHKCSDCGQAFSEKRSLHRHVMQKHGQDKKSVGKQVHIPVP